MTAIGYIGVGSMGGALAERLLLTHPIHVHDHLPAAEQRLAALGATAERDARVLAAKCDVVVLCLPTSHHVDEVLFGENGIAAAARPGTLVIDQTTGNPFVTRALAERLRTLDIELVDAPVSGGTAGAAAGTIAIMVGATDDAYQRALPILQMISPNVFHAGGVGNGHMIKIVNNLLSCTQRLLTMEGMSLAAKNGVDPKVALEILGAGGGRNAYLEKIEPKVLDGDLQSGFTLGLALKDVRLACDVGEQSSVPMFLGGLTRELYTMFAAELGAVAQVDTAALVVDRLAGTSVVPAQTP